MSACLQKEIENNPAWQRDIQTRLIYAVCDLLGAILPVFAKTVGVEGKMVSPVTVVSTDCSGTAVLTYVDYRGFI